MMRLSTCHLSGPQSRLALNAFQLKIGLETIMVLGEPG
jgi:hypothetical protein